MPEHAAPAEAEEEEAWYHPVLEGGGLAHGASEFRAVNEATEGFRTVRGGAAGLQAMEGAELAEGARGLGISNYLAPVALASGINNLINGEGPTEKIAGGLETISGGVGTLGLAGGAATSLGASGAGAAMTGAAAAAAPVAAVAGAGAAGMAIGNAGNNFMSHHGWLGDNEDGTHRNWSDMASDWGVSAHDAVGDGVLGDVAGLGATLGGSVVGAAGAAGSAVLSLGETIGGGISSLFSW